VRALLLKPQTYMNESGRAVGAAMQFFKVKPDQVVVFYDEIDMAPAGSMKTGRRRGGPQRHRSITSQIGPDFRRRRIGRRATR
jgi:PTH1 family peptidyl-tRNA hydrolase